MNNLYDKYKFKKWHQLWADDNRAFVILPDGRELYQVIVDNGRFRSTERKLTLSEAFDSWNTEINRYLATNSEVKQ